MINSQAIKRTMVQMSGVLSAATEALMAKRRRKHLKGVTREQTSLAQSVAGPNAAAAGHVEDDPQAAGWQALQGGEGSSPPRSLEVLRSPGSARLDHSGSSRLRHFPPAALPVGFGDEEEVLGLVPAESVEEVHMGVSARRLTPREPLLEAGGSSPRGNGAHRVTSRPALLGQELWAGEDLSTLPGSPIASQRRQTPSSGPKTE